MSDGITDMMRDYDEYNPEIDYLKKENKQLKEEIDKLKFMINNGLSWEDMRNGTPLPHEI
jgi:peptidoglycan hydrolase CwlO-like protein